MPSFLVFFSFFFCLMGAFTASGRVVLLSNNVTVSFEDIEANFAPSVKGSGICGNLTVADPLDACFRLTNKKASNTNNTGYPFLLIIRGGCSFEDKVRTAQVAGYKAAIVYNNENGDLVAMSGNSAGIKIPAVFVSKASGETLAKYARSADVELCISPSYENSAWSIMAMSFISLLAMSAVLATCFFVPRHRIRRERPQTSPVREFHGISSRLVKAMPSLIFTAVLEDNCPWQTCAICLEDYNIGEKLRILPCCHTQTSWRTFCPVCKHDVRNSTAEPPASESTPLLSSTLSSSSVLSSVRSSFVSSSSALQIGPSYNQSISSTPCNHHSNQTHHQSPHISTSRSSVDLNQRSDSAYLVSPHSLGYTSLLPLNSRYISPYIPSRGNASSSYVGSSSHQPNQLHYSESASSFSPFASTHSLPGC